MGLKNIEHTAIGDFVPLDETTGRYCLSWWRRVLLDFVCRQTGHLLWRLHGSRRDNPEGSLPLNVTICRRCGLGGYVKGDYWQDLASIVKQSLAEDLKRAKQL